MSHRDSIDNFETVLPYYRTSLDGTFKDANSALLRLLGYASLADLKRHDVLDLYVNEQDRSIWLESLLASGHTDMTVQYKKALGGSVWVRDIATLPPIQRADGVNPDSSVDEVVGFLIPMEQEQRRSFYYDKHVHASDMLFDQAKVGIIKLDSEARVIYANDYMRRRFPGISSVIKERLGLLSLVENGGNDAERLNVALGRMVLLENEPGEPIAITMQLPDGCPTPVSIQLFYIGYTTPGVRDASTICKIQDLRLPKLIENFLREYGPRHSLLEELGIKTIIKQRTVSEGGAIESRFVWANEAFLKEIGKSLEDIRGQTDRKLFPKHFEQYHKRDTFVLATKSTVQTIEQHPAVDGQDHVFVMKTTTEPYDHVYVFYWTFSGGEFESICREMSVRIGGMYVSILDCFPFPIFLRNENDRFVYANKAFCKHIGRTRFDVIGMTDAEIFADRCDLAAEYLSVDHRVLQIAGMSSVPHVDGNLSECSITREESNVDSTGTLHRVIVTKTANPINRGVEGVFWAKHDIERRLARGAQLLKECKLQMTRTSPVDVFVSYAKEDLRWLAGDDVARVRNEKRELVACLATLSSETRSRYRPWHDGDIKQEWWAEIESAMAECRVAIILLSTHYFDREGFAYNVEAPALLRRAEQESGDFRIFLVELSSFPKLEDDEIQRRLNRFTTINRMWANNSPIDEVSDPVRGKLWSRLTEAVKTFLSTGASDDRTA